MDMFSIEEEIEIIDHEKYISTTRMIVCDHVV